MYIYLVRVGDLLTGSPAPLAAFTDPRRLREWLLERDSRTVANMKVWRLVDGGIGAAVEIDLNEILIGNLKEGQ
jgi:hypothetical protein